MMYADDTVLFFADKDSDVIQSVLKDQSWESCQFGLLKANCSSIKKRQKLYYLEPVQIC